MKNRILVLGWLLIAVSVATASPPQGYYDATQGLSGQALKTALYNTIKGHTELSYSDLWTAFQKTDKRPDGKVWDIYSNITNYVFGDDQDRGSGGTSENQFYNREHSFPKSWFDDGYPMYTDLFHLYPSDKWVNGKRGNTPFGTVQTVTGTSANNYSKWGTSTESGATLTVFEPADELKGDMARTYFYMVTRYENVVASWKSNANTEMLAGNSYPALSNWGVKLLLAWHRNDPVSPKEINRNEVIYSQYQHNRNPYIDEPRLVEYIWGDSIGYAFLPTGSVGLERPMDDNRPKAYCSDCCWWVTAKAGQRLQVFDLLGRRLLATTLMNNPYRLDIPQTGYLLLMIGTTPLYIVKDN
ncbi:MAG: ribonuclease [Bacteroidales bacterium]|nr:ribonuclease [Bacteroidales bacterium]